MKKVFELYINNKFIQYIKKSEVRLLPWIETDLYTLKPVELTPKIYKVYFG